ncbi:unnamed protein product, partial [Thlaspi arvense]
MNNVFGGGLVLLQNNLIHHLGVFARNSTQSPLHAEMKTTLLSNEDQWRNQIQGQIVYTLLSFVDENED